MYNPNNKLIEKIELPVWGFEMHPDHWVSYHIMQFIVSWHMSKHGDHNILLE